MFRLLGLGRMRLVSANGKPFLLQALQEFATPLNEPVLRAERMPPYEFFSHPR